MTKAKCLVCVTFSGEPLEGYYSIAVFSTKTGKLIEHVTRRLIMGEFETVLEHAVNMDYPNSQIVFDNQNARLLNFLKKNFPSKLYTFETLLGNKIIGCRMTKTLKDKLFLTTTQQEIINETLGIGNAMLFENLNKPF